MERNAPREIRVSRILGKQPSLYGVTSNQVIPLCLFALAAIVAKKIFNIPIIDAFLIFAGLTVAWLIVTKNRIGKFFERFQVPPNYCIGRVRYRRILPNNNNNDCRGSIYRPRD
jgi:hypothetical protein